MALRSDPPSRTDQLAQRKAVQDQSFFREVDDAVRQDEMASAFKRYGVAVLALVLVLLAALAAFLWWQNHRAAQTDRHSEQLTQALDQVEAGQVAAADTELQALAQDRSSGAGVAAALTRAGLAEDQGKASDAAKAFEAIAADTDAPQALRDLATIRAVAVAFDQLPPQQVIDRLKPLAVPGGPWFGNAGELVGMAYLKQGKRDLAGPLLASISRDRAAPQSLRRRARQLAGLLGADAIDDVAKAISDDGPDAAQ